MLERTQTLSCEPLDRDPEQGPLANGALDGVVCQDPIEGVSELRLYEFPGTYRLRLYRRARVERTGGQAEPHPMACADGRPGVRKWEHGHVACWFPGDRQEAVLHWTDERTDTYGIIRADTGATPRIETLWETLANELVPDASEDLPSEGA